MGVRRYAVVLISLILAIMVIVGCQNPAGSNGSEGNGGDTTEDGDNSDGSEDGDNSDTTEDGDNSDGSEDALSATSVAFFRADAGRDDIAAVMNDGSQQTILFQLRADDLHVDGADNTVYWLDGEHHKLQRVNSDGSGFEVLLSNSNSLEDARGFAIDTVNDTMYWIRVQGGENHLMRANLDGSTVEQLATLSGDPNDVAVAASAGYVFVSAGSDTDAEVTRLNLDGTSQVSIADAEDGVRVAKALAVDTDNNIVYWIDGETSDEENQTIEGVAFDGSGSVETLYVAGSFSNLADLAVDPQGTYVYWVDRGYQQLSRIGTTQDAEDESLASSVSFSTVSVDTDNVYVFGLGDQLASFGDEPGMISTTDLDGTNLAQVIAGTSINGPEKIAFDASSETIYWTEGEVIKRANFDGSGAEIAIDSDAGAADPASLFVDAGNAHLYWSNGDSPRQMYRSGLDGSNPVTILTSDQVNGTAVDLFVDATGDFIYWADDDGLNDTVRRGKLDGTGIETVVDDAFGVSAIDVDTSNEKVYWSVALSSGGDKVARANFDDTGEVTVVSDPSDPEDVALDVAAGYLYWSEGGSGSTPVIGRSNLDGTDSEDIVTNGLTLPTGIAVW